MIYKFDLLSCSPVISLEQAINETCNNSDSVKMMKETLVKSKQMIREKWSAVYPNLSTTLFGGRSYGSVFGGSSKGGGSRGDYDITDPQGNKGGPDFSTIIKEMAKPRQIPMYSASINVSQPIYTFGKVGTAIKVANQFDSSIQYSYKRNRQHIQLLALDAYFQALLASMAADISERSLARKKELSDFMDRNFKMGSGSKAQILAVLADMKGQYTDVMTARQNARAAIMGLCALMGRPVSDTLQTDTAATILELITMTLPGKDDAVQIALTGRGDLRSLAFLTKANLGGAKIFKAMNLPNIAPGMPTIRLSKVEFLFNTYPLPSV
jgi:outer membrane protein TolC